MARKPTLRPRKAQPARPDFFPVVLATSPPTIMTRADVESYFRERGTVVRCTHIPATHPRDEDGQ